jgi:hypothetical protein
MPPNEALVLTVHLIGVRQKWLAIKASARSKQRAKPLRKPTCERGDGLLCTFARASQAAAWVRSADPRSLRTDLAGLADMGSDR